MQVEMNNSLEAHKYTHETDIKEAKTITRPSIDWWYLEWKLKEKRRAISRLEEQLKSNNSVDLEGVCGAVIKTIRNYHCHYAVEQDDP